jgi:zinc finger FYVE domain-containing protein 26
MQRENYDIGEEAIQRFSLPAEDKASLELAEWVAGAYKRALVCLHIKLSYSSANRAGSFSLKRWRRGMGKMYLNQGKLESYGVPYAALVSFAEK